MASLLGCMVGLPKSRVEASRPRMARRQTAESNPVLPAESNPVLLSSAGARGLMRDVRAAAHLWKAPRSPSALLPSQRIQVNKVLPQGVAELVWSEVGDFHDLRWLAGTQRIKYEGNPQAPGATRTFRTGGVETLLSLDTEARRLTWSLDRFDEYEGGISVSKEKVSFWIKACCPERLLQIARTTAEAQLEAVVSFAEERVRLRKALIVVAQIPLKDCEAYKKMVAVTERPALKKLMASGDLFQGRVEVDSEEKMVYAFEVWRDADTRSRHMRKSYAAKSPAELAKMTDMSRPMLVHEWCAPDPESMERMNMFPIGRRRSGDCDMFLCRSVMDVGRDNVVLHTEMPVKSDKVEECEDLLRDLEHLVRPMSKSGLLRDVRFHLDRASGRLYALHVFDTPWDFEHLLADKAPYREMLDHLASVADGPMKGVLWGPSYAETPSESIRAFCSERGIRMCKPNLLELLGCKPRLAPLPAHVQVFPSETKDRVHNLLARLDRYTSTVLDILPRRILDSARSLEAEPYTIHEPTSMHSIERKVLVGQFPFWVSATDDYFGRQTWVDQLLFGALANSLLYPHDDKILDVPDDLVDCMKAELLFDRIIPPSSHVFPEVSSDGALERAIVSGVFSQWVKEDPHGDLMVDYSSISDFAPREGFRRLGATAYLDMMGKLKGIYVCDTAAMVKPGDDAWEDAKTVFKTSGALWSTTVDHLLGIHMIATNCVINSAVKTLPATHTIRRLLQPFSFRSVYTNKRSLKFLVDPHSILLHACGFEHDTFMSYLEIGAMKCEAWLTPPERIARAGRKVEALVEERRFPYGEDAIRLYDALFAFVDDWVCGEYAGDEAVVADTAVQAFAKDLYRQTRNLIFCTPERFATREELSKVLATFIFNATGGHEYTGMVREYIGHPSFLGLRLREGSNRVDMQSWLLGQLLFCVPSLPMPELMSDFKECFTTAVEQRRWRSHREVLKAVSSTIDTLNRTMRAHPFKSFMPTLLDCAVSM